MTNILEITANRKDQLYCFTPSLSLQMIKIKLYDLINLAYTAKLRLVAEQQLHMNHNIVVSSNICLQLRIAELFQPIKYRVLNNLCSWIVKSGLVRVSICEATVSLHT